MNTLTKTKNDDTNILLKSTIKTIIKQKFNGVYESHSFSNIVNMIMKLLNTNDVHVKNMVNRLLCKYTHIINDKMMIDTNNPSYNQYENITKFLVVKYDMKQIKRTDKCYGPFSNSWVHDKIQFNDDISSSTLRYRYKIFKKLQSIIYPPQRSQQWFAERDGLISASDIGLTIGDEHRMPIFVIVKKMRETFSNNKFTYHGKKMEEIATMIYEYRMNVKTEEFGLCHHPDYPFLGASPDGIVSEYKHDGIHLTELVGRMLEIKCPVTRKINCFGEVRGTICPTYYWDQVQIQLECCDLDECDFWQCDIKEYSSKEEFENDTIIDEAYRSKKTTFEKGCLVQILPKDKIVPHDDPTYNDVVYGCAQFIHPPKIEMTPKDCDEWSQNVIKNLNKTHPDYCLDKVIYWYLNFSHCEKITRNRDWFSDNINKIKVMWDRILLLRSNDRYKKLFLDWFDYYIPSCNEYSRDPKIEELQHGKNKLIIDMLDEIAKLKGDKLENYVTDLENKIKLHKK